LILVVRGVKLHEMTPNATPHRDAAAPADLPWRVIGLLNVFRLLVPMVLVVVFFFNAPDRTLGRTYPGMFLGVCVAYFTFALVSIQAIQRRWPSAEWMALFPLAVDTVAISMLIHASGGVTSGLATLLFLPAGATAAIVRPRLALAATALIAIALLFETVISALGGSVAGADFLVAGLTGASLFAVTLLAIPLAHRLRESEALVKQRDIDLANLNELNEFIVQHLRESILVVDAADRVRLVNETASRLLRGDPVQPGALLGEVSPRLLYLLDTWRKQASDRRDTQGEVVSADGGTVIRPHFVSLSGSGAGPVLVFLEDTSVVAERVQQSKLASLGRLSASIAHEIRNPVGAMSHASQLLRESPALGPDDRQLTDIIEKNAVRVSQIIDNVLQLSRRDATRQERLDLPAWLAAFLEEFRQTMQLDTARLRIEGDLGTALPVQFDPTHLHQVTWNLCENALRHGSAEAPVQLRVGRIASTGRPFLEIADRGAGIELAQAERIFEPFFSGGAGGTGLGLFISRELCQTNGALLAYEARPGGGSIFRVIFADPQRWEW
jgi:two-component system sensor histidine kinase PilS (NtrC family)